MKKEYSHPGDLLPDFGRFFGTLARWQFNKFNLTVPQTYTLLAVSEYKIISMNELSKFSKVSQTTMTRMVNNLVRGGYLERIRDEKDRRVVYVTLTKKGLNMADKLNQSLKQLGDAIFSRIPSDKRDQMFSSLLLMLNAMEEVFITKKDA